MMTIRPKLHLAAAFALAHTAGAAGMGWASAGNAEAGHQVPPPPDADASESRCGTTWDAQDVELYDGTLGVSVAFVDAHERPVGQLQWRGDLATRYGDPGNVNDVRWCSGTLISRNLFLTAGHCFDVDLNDGVAWDFPIDDRTGEEITPEQAAQEMHVNLNYQLDTSGNLRTPVVVPVVRMLEYRIGGLDYAILELEGQPGDDFGIAELSSEIPDDDETLTIIQHPNGAPKVVEVGNYAGIEDSGSLAGYMRYTDLDTMGGSSGSGVLNAAGEVVGVHTNAGCGDFGGANHGVLMSDIEAVSDLIPVAPTYPPGLAEITKHGVPASSYQSVFDGIVSSGYRLVWVDGYRVGGTAYFNMIFRPANGVAWVSRHGMSATAYQSEFNRWTSRGYRLLQVDSYRHGSAVRYAAIFVKQSGPSWVAYHNVSESRHQELFGTYADRGYRAVNVSVVSVGGKRRVTALYDKGSTGGSWVAYHGIAQADYPKVHDAQSAAGRTLRYLNAYLHDGKVFYSGIWYKTSYAAHYARHGLTSSLYQGWSSWLTAYGYLTEFVTGHYGSTHVYSALWAKPPTVYFPIGLTGF